MTYLDQLRTACDHYRSEIKAHGWTPGRAKLLRTAEDYFMLEHGKIARRNNGTEAGR